MPMIDIIHVQGGEEGWGEGGYSYVWNGGRAESLNDIRILDSLQ